MAPQPRPNRPDRDELARRLADACLLSDELIARSGETSNQHFDKYRFESDPVLLASVARHMVPMVPDEADVLAGIELGGVPVAVALSLATGLPAAFIRNEASAHGAGRSVEGAEISGRHVLVIEGVVSSGAKVLAAVDELASGGAIVEHALCVVDRGGADGLADHGVKLHSLFTIAEIDALGRKQPAPPDHRPTPGGQSLPRREGKSRPDRKAAPRLLPRRSHE